MKKSTKTLLGIYRKLPDEVAQQLLDYAEFLSLRYQVEVKEIIPPNEIARPESESVVAAVKRLSATYPMLDKDKLLNDTAGLVSQHILQGRESIEVIDELEVIFSHQYTLLIDELKQDSAE